MSKDNEPVAWILDSNLDLTDVELKFNARNFKPEALNGEEFVPVYLSAPQEQLAAAVNHGLRMAIEVAKHGDFTAPETIWRQIESLITQPAPELFTAEEVAIELDKCKQDFEFIFLHSGKCEGSTIRAKMALERLNGVAESAPYFYRAEQVAGIKNALKQSMVAFDDWLSIFAEEFCDELRVKEAKARMYEYGLIGYIADVQQTNREALAGIQADSPKLYSN